MQILFVCTGNMCRSPFAEGYLRKVFQETGRRGIAVSSAGTLGLRYRPASRGIIEVAREHGIALEEHRTRPLNGGMLQKADLVVVMEEAHRHQIEEHWPGEAGKVRFLRQFESPEGDAPPRDLFDPMARPLEDYRVCADHMARCVRNLAAHLRDEV